MEGALVLELDLPGLWAGLNSGCWNGWCAEDWAGMDAGIC